MDIWQLYKYQEIDLEISANEKKLSEASVQLKEINEGAISTETYEKNKAILNKNKAKINQSNLEILSIEDQIKIQEKRLYGGTIVNTKELKNLEKDISLLKQKHDKIEEETLMLMEDCDVLDSKLEKAEIESQEKKAQIEDKKSVLNKLCIEIENNILGLKDKLKQQKTYIDNEAFDIYSLLKPKKNGIVVAKMQGNTCGGCHVNLPDYCMEKLRGRETVKCPICGRILLAATQ